MKIFFVEQQSKHQVFLINHERSKLEHCNRSQSWMICYKPFHAKNATIVTIVHGLTVYLEYDLLKGEATRYSSFDRTDVITKKIQVFIDITVFIVYHIKWMS
jgi:hypothetical protein